MRAKRVLNLALGLFVLVAVALVAWQTLSARVPASSAPTSSQLSASVSVPAVGDRSATPPLAPAPAVTASAVPAPPPAVEPPAVAVDAPPVTRNPANATPKAVTPSHKVVAMYFHGNVRCATCRKVEAYAKEAVEEGFKEQVAAGEVEFRPVNVDQPENRHFIEDYQLTNKSVVVTEEVGGSVARWVKLDSVWGLVGDRDASLAYVQDAVRAYAEN